MKKILKGAVVLLIAITMFFSTVAIADTQEKINETSINPTGSLISNDQQNSWNNIQQTIGGTVIFENLPWDPSDPCNGYYSDDDQGFRCYDNFYGLADPISDVHWWGLEAFDDNDPTGSTLVIEFYNDVGGIPDVGSPVATFTGIVGSNIMATDTGVVYFGYNLWFLEYDLPTDVVMTSGWVGIWKQASGGGERWVWIEGFGDYYCYHSSNGVMTDRDFAFQLTKNEPPTPPQISGPASGKKNTLLDYTFTSSDPDADQVSYLIDWGDGTPPVWSAFQISGAPYLASHSWDNDGTYIITAKAKDTSNHESITTTFTVTIPRNKAINNPFLNWLQSHPNLFPLLQKLIHQLGFGL